MQVAPRRDAADAARGPVALPSGRSTPPDGTPVVAEGAKAPRRASPRRLEVKSPMVGTFYGAPEPGAKPYVAVGHARRARGRSSASSRR